jgi:hypothetical protein
MWIDILVLLIPLTVGVFQTLKKYDLIDDFTENLNDWIKEKMRNNSRSNTLAAMTVRYSLIPFLSLFIIIHDLTEDIRDFGLKSGVRIASYLYLMVFLFVVSITFGYKVLFLMLIALLLLNVFMLLHNHFPQRHTNAAGDSSQDFVETIWPFFRADSTRERVAGLFNVPQIDVDYTGNILAYDRGDSPGKKKIGRVDQLGHIYDTRHAASKKVGWINEHGHVVCDSIINIF